MYDHLPWLAANATDFPDVTTAMDEPNGLVAFGGDLSAPRLVSAYQHGIFPWYTDDQPIMWWSPDPRLVLCPEAFKLSRSLKKTLKNKTFQIRVDQAFTSVIKACAEPRPSEDGTWITEAMQCAYFELHQQGVAHSVEVYDAENQLVGGLYGVSMGRIFCGESMFSRVPDASKIALYALTTLAQRVGITIIDCQVATEHLMRLGAKHISRAEYLEQLQASLDHPIDWHSLQQQALQP